MFTRRLPLLWTFVGGCLSGAVLIGFWPGETETIPSPTKQRVARTSEAIPPPIATTTAVRERAIPDDAPDERTEQGSSVADVLARLEAAYRKELSAAAPADSPASAGRDLATTTRADAQPTEVGAPVPTHAGTAVALAPAAPANAPERDAHPKTTPEVDQTTLIALREDAEPRNINVHVGDVNQNTHVGDVIEGDVHRGDVYFVQPPAVFGYLPFYAQYRNGKVTPPAYTPPGTTSRGTSTFATSWTVPSARLTYDSALIPMLK